MGLVCLSATQRGLARGGAGQGAVVVAGQASLAGASEGIVPTVAVAGGLLQSGDAAAPRARRTGIALRDDVAEANKRGREAHASSSDVRVCAWP